MPRPGIISRVAGPFVVARNMTGSKMHEVVKVGSLNLIGEIIRLEGDKAMIQVYEDTTGVKIGERVEGTGKPLSIELGPGLIGQIYDGVQRPLPTLKELVGPLIKRGVSAPALPRDKKWHFKPAAKKGKKMTGGDILGAVDETSLIQHKILVPPLIEGVIEQIVDEGNYTITDVIAEIRTKKGSEKLKLSHSWPVRQPRPCKVIIPPKAPLLTGQRVIDVFFPVAKGGAATTSGGFGTGKTILLHQLARWSDADIIIFVGCGERGNEMAEVVERFPQLKDIRTGQPIMNRTVLVANTSDMPITAREASIYTAMTIGEYYRDMGYDVALMADSTSRWAEALREICGRLEEMPGEEEYPAYLASRLAEYYARAGQVVTIGSEERAGSITVIGAVSPPGGDFSEPVTKNTLMLTKVFWALDFNLSHRRHFPAIDYFTSYSEYLTAMEPWYKKNMGADWLKLRDDAMVLLKQEEELREIVSLVGSEVLAESQRVVFEAASMVRECFLVQSAYHPADSYSPSEKTYNMLRLLLKFHQKMKLAVSNGVPLNRILALPVREEVSRMRFTSSEEFSKIYENIDKKIDDQINELISRVAKGEEI